MTRSGESYHTPIVASSKIGSQDQANEEHTGTLKDMQISQSQLPIKKNESSDNANEDTPSKVITSKFNLTKKDNDLEMSSSNNNNGENLHDEA